MTEPLAPTTIGERQAIAEGGDWQATFATPGADPTGVHGLAVRLGIAIKENCGIGAGTAELDKETGLLSVEADLDLNGIAERVLAGLFLATPTTNAPVADQPIDMLLFCPKCGKQHIDEPAPVELGEEGRPIHWTNPPHRSHLCHGCGCIWRPADVATNGVATIATLGKADTWSDIWSAPAILRQALPIHGEMREALEAQTAIVDRLCSAIERTECDIGGESIATVLAELGPANDRARNALQGDGL